MLAAEGRYKMSHFSSVVREVSSTLLIHSPQQQSSYQGPGTSEEQMGNRLQEVHGCRSCQEHPFSQA